ncbi:DUF2778 domain-containing protein [Caulobacter sp. SLTY]|uniref:tlde1 domain-containing protein n=1 Tax=Caulobacter sp. SLTY TaxID=2683262 RepID=UPI00141262BD|nr:tlde1 domain-containing protein [Caulobacter sp. SLTY]NBB17027.1 DUF2778 domain-containing protein [Caulobacter sp. SLTY]
MWTYRQRTGHLLKDGVFVAKGYSGDGPAFAEGRNNPDMEHIKGKGPIPRGRWTISKPRNSVNVGPHAMDLVPVGHDAHGRTAFMIHGDNKAQDASRGCIILPRNIREKISASGDRKLTVVE